MADLLGAETPRIYRLIAELAKPGETVLAALGYVFGARIAQEKLGLPLATIHLQPMWFRSTYDPPGLPRWCPAFVPRAIDRVIDAVADRVLGPATNQFRGELGLPPGRRLMKTWWNSPQRVIGFFPDRFKSAAARLAGQQPVARVPLGVRAYHRIRHGRGGRISGRG